MDSDEPGPANLNKLPDFVRLNFFTESLIPKIFHYCKFLVISIQTGVSVLNKNNFRNLFFCQYGSQLMTTNYGL